MKSRDYQEDIYFVLKTTEQALNTSDVNERIEYYFGYRLDSFSILGYLQTLQSEGLVVFKDGGYLPATLKAENDVPAL